MSKKKERFELTELFLVKADWDRTFMGTIKREKDEDGRPIIRGAVMVNEGHIYSMAGILEKLGEYMDAICVMKLDRGLHDKVGVFSAICKTKYFLN